MSDVKASQDQEPSATPDSTEPVHQRIQVELPELLGEVAYEYSNLVRLASSKTDLRLAFGDVTPTGKLNPKFGVVLSHNVAKALLTALTRTIETVEGQLGSEISPQQGIEINVQPPEVPAGES